MSTPTLEREVTYEVDLTALSCKITRRTGSAVTVEELEHVPGTSHWMLRTSFGLVGGTMAATNGPHGKRVTVNAATQLSRTWRDEELSARGQLR